MAATVIPAGAVPEIQEYSLPLEISNGGGSDSGSFTVTLYLDGEKIAAKEIPDGVRAHSSITTGIPVFTAPGYHTLKIVIDEAGLVSDQNRGNNVVQGRYEFPA
jgi:subtilase family serine protease